MASLNDAPKRVRWSFDYFLYANMSEGFFPIYGSAQAQPMMAISDSPRGLPAVPGGDVY